MLSIGGTFEIVLALFDSVQIWRFIGMADLFTATLHVSYGRDQVFTVHNCLRLAVVRARPENW